MTQTKNWVLTKVSADPSPSVNCNPKTSTHTTMGNAIFMVVFPLQWNFVPHEVQPSRDFGSNNLLNFCLRSWPQTFYFSSDTSSSSMFLFTSWPPIFSSTHLLYWTFKTTRPFYRLILGNPKQIDTFHLLLIPIRIKLISPFFKKKQS